MQDGMADQSEVSIVDVRDHSKKPSCRLFDAVKSCRLGRAKKRRLLDQCSHAHTCYPYIGRRRRGGPDHRYSSSYDVEIVPPMQVD